VVHAGSSDVDPRSQELTALVGNCFTGLSLGTYGILDSGASVHVVNDINLFSKVQSCNILLSGLSGDTRCRKIGEVDLRVGCDSKQVRLRLRNVYYMPTCKLNLISVGRLVRDKATVHFSDSDPYFELQGSRVELERRGPLLLVPMAAWTERKSKIVGVQGSNVAPLALGPSAQWREELGSLGSNSETETLSETSVLAATRVDLSQQGQRADVDLSNVVIPPNLEVIDAGMVTLDKMAARLGFAPGRVVDGMRKRNQLKGVTVRGKGPGVAEERHNTEATRVGNSSKQPTVHRRREMSKATSPFHTIHSDVACPLIKSFGGNEYFVTFIDDFTRYSVVYPMAHKSEVPERFEEFLRLVRKFGDVVGRKFKIQRLISDGGGEYTSERMDELTRRWHIDHRITPPHTPEMNGVAERFNQTVVRVANRMLTGACLAAPFWALAIQYATDVINVLPSSRRGDRCSHELLFGNVPRLNMFRVFGADCYVHKHDRNKFGDAARKGLFVGLSPSKERWLVFHPDLRTVTEEKHCVCVEDMESRRNYLRTYDDLEESRDTDALAFPFSTSRKISIPKCDGFRSGGYFSRVTSCAVLQWTSLCLGVPVGATTARMRWRMNSASRTRRPRLAAVAVFTRTNARRPPKFSSRIEDACRSRWGSPLSTLRQ